MKLVWKLLRQHISVLQLAGFFLTNLVGVAIILTAVQLYRDVRPVVAAPDSFLDNDYLILSKQVEGAGVGKVFFTREEVGELERQPFVESLGEFTPARYRVTAGISMGGIGMETMLFLESVPDRFLDVESRGWKFEEGDNVIPIIIPRNYLNLYNFGFASTQGLPQVGEELIQKINLTVEIGGRGRRQEFRGRIVAFSNRLNTILVPQSFIEWSNAGFADRPAAEPSRIIAEVRNSADERLHKYLTDNGYVVEGDNHDGGRASYFLRMITGVVAGVGLLITVLSFFILMLSIFLLLQKNTRKLEDLLLVGYTPAQVSRPYQILTLVLNLLVLVCAVPLVLCARSAYLPLTAMIAEGGAGADVWPTLLCGLGVAIAVTLMNAAAIRRKVNGLWSRD